jgi:hypothetical protein
MHLQTERQARGKRKREGKIETSRSRSLSSPDPSLSSPDPREAAASGWEEKVDDFAGGVMRRLTAGEAWRRAALTGPRGREETEG